ncbi:hypothetical protein DFJ74DRAFT_706112 [Hyaloraphidium curvatum]|nr:hypothetical protein DFJ74DRAFT_706112 [Hyaloraphidium curvatum]
MHLSRIPLLPRPSLLLPAARRGVQLGSHMTQDPEVWEKEKERTLKGEVKSHLKNAPGWNEKLASVSEAAEPDGDIGELQKETIAELQEEDAREAPAGDISNREEMRPELGDATKEGGRG